MSLDTQAPLRDGSLALPALMAQVAPLLQQQPFPVYLAGGAVRDALLGEASYDLDFAVPSGAISLAFAVGDLLGAPAFAMDRERDIGRVVLPDQQTMLDFATFRGQDLEADLRARDFTINALALPVARLDDQELIDPTGGLEDLRAGVIRLTHQGALLDDPVRALRAVRLSARFGFALLPATAAAVRAAADSLRTTSAERVRDELLKILETGQPQQGLLQMADLGLLEVILPELARLQGVQQSPPHHEPVLAHTASVLSWLLEVEAAVVDGQSVGDESLLEAQGLLAPFWEELAAHLNREVMGSLSGVLLLRLGALFHDVGKGEIQTTDPDGRIRFLGHDKIGARLAARRLRALRLSNEAVHHVQRIVAGHMRPLFLNQTEKVTRRAIYRFFRDTGAAGLDIGLLSLADHLATYDGPGEQSQWHGLLAVVRQLYQHYFEAYEETVAPPPLLDGNELMAALDLSPGPEVGRLLRLLEEAQAAGEVNSRDEALALLRAAQQSQ